MINNEKYILLKESLKAIKKGDINILTLTGSAGVGKTFNTLEYLREKEINYVYVNSYATPLSFYELLYENRNKEVIIFDDLHGVNHPLVLSMLKSACWVSDSKRIVSYHSTSKKMEDRGLPSSFEFNTNVILIFNKLIPGYESITNRGITISFRFNFKDKIKVFEEVKNDAEIEEKVLELFDDEELRVRFSKNALETAKNYDWEVIGKTYMKIICFLCRSYNNEKEESI